MHENAKKKFVKTGPLVLGIETSCDETAVAIHDQQHGLLGHELFSQIAVHAEYGGVVPELAARDHVRRLPLLLDALFEKTGIEPAQLDAVAYTAGPGLVGALLTGASFGRTLAYTLDIPALEIHHMEGHLLAPLLETPAPTFPFVALLVSGGHSMLVSVNGIGQYEVLGQTLDDAAGEAFDKTAKMLGLPYPGGPHLARAAEQGDDSRFRFPRPMTDRPGMEMSFSGLKTFTLNTWQNCDQGEQDRADIAACFQRAVVDTLAIKCKRALAATGCNSLVVAGGVGANLDLRSSLKALMESLGGTVYYPRLEFCTDNAAMIAFAGSQRITGPAETSMAINVRPRWPLDELAPV